MSKTKSVWEVSGERNEAVRKLSLDPFSARNLSLAFHLPVHFLQIAPLPRKCMVEIVAANVQLVRPLVRAPDKPMHEVVEQRDSCVGVDWHVHRCALIRVHVRGADHRGPGFPVKHGTDGGSYEDGIAHTAHT